MTLVYTSMALKYTVSELFSIGRQLGRQAWPVGLDQSKLKALDILKPYRGCRAGKFKQRPIKALVTDRFVVQQPHVAPGVNRNNFAVLSMSTKTDKYQVSIPTVKAPTKKTQRKVTRERSLCNVEKSDDSIPPKHLTICYLNARSVKNKADDIADLMVERKIDICAITETWLSATESDKIAIGNLTPPGYSVLHVPRSKGRGGWSGYCL